MQRPRQIDAMPPRSSPRGFFLADVAQQAQALGVDDDPGREQGPTYLGHQLCLVDAVLGRRQARRPEQRSGLVDRADLVPGADRPARHDAGPLALTFFVAAEAGAEEAQALRRQVFVAPLDLKTTSGAFGSLPPPMSAGPATGLNNTGDMQSAVRTGP